MSYIRARELSGEYLDETVERAMTRPDAPQIDMDMDFEILDFVLALIEQVNNLEDGQALVVWKEIF